MRVCCLPSLWHGCSVEPRRRTLGVQLPEAPRAAGARRPAATVEHCCRRRRLCWGWGIGACCVTQRHQGPPLRHTACTHASCSSCWVQPSFTTMSRQQTWTPQWMCWSGRRQSCCSRCARAAFGVHSGAAWGVHGGRHAAQRRIACSQPHGMGAAGHGRGCCAAACACRRARNVRSYTPAGPPRLSRWRGGLTRIDQCCRRPFSSTDRPPQQ